VDGLPVVLLAAIAGAGSFTHIRDTAAQHGQHGPMSWAIAVSVDLTCVMAARERQRDRRLGIAARRASWPAAVLAGAVLLSLSANLAQPTPWGQAIAAAPSAAFLVAVSMLERRTGARMAVSGQDAPSSLSQEPSPAEDGTLLAQARRAAVEYQARCGQPITRDVLRARLRVSSQAASDLRRQIRNSTQAI
jgi:hypothetical protein